MSQPNAIASLTRTLATLLENTLQDADASFRVTTLPPDKSNAETTPANRLNLFLFQVAHNAAWRNADLPDRTRPGEPGSPPLALTLSYLITAYGEAGPEMKDHHILGLAMSYFHNHPVLNPDDIHNLAPGSGLENQVERVRFIPRTMALEELVKMWGAVQTQYRISAAYDAAVVLIDPLAAGAAPAPVLQRGSQDQGVIDFTGLPPALDRILPPELLRRNGLPIYPPAALLGQVLTLEGQRLPIANTLLLVSTPAWQGRRARIEPLTSGPRADTLLATLAAPPVEDPPVPPPVVPPPPLAWAPGIYSAALVVRKTGLPDVVSNVVPLTIAPQVTLNPLTHAAGDFDLDVACTPAPRDGQTVLLLLTGREPLAPTTVTPPAAPGDPAGYTFHLTGMLAGDYLARLRVDGVDSLPYRMARVAGQQQLQFDPNGKLTIT
jgi:hypothetical protein